ncbi:hypothetical protein KP509_22G012100 [Ceratopteris richardii]|uniref:MACPF domain-containing protein n=1 Tax=Ceratopteris richardii TaxID=49495 RepID=A0A8T2S5F1_CERRI|nr:hypothetical protein KP509_22G012100 [Ceratopteris richardii]
MHASFVLGKSELETILASTKHTVQEENQHVSTNELYMCECLYIPLYSFQIPRNRMFLSEAALERALDVQSEFDAGEFFKSFGAFASESEYNLGGVFIKQKAVKLSECTSLDSLLQIAETETKFELDAAYNNPLYNINVKNESASKSSTNSNFNEQISKSVKKGQESIFILGPNGAMDMQEFLEKLRHDPEKSMAIIDKTTDDSSTLVGVWELLLKHADGKWAHGNITPDVQTTRKLKGAAKILCGWWHQKAKWFLSRLPQSTRPPLFNKTEWDRLLSRNEAFLADIPNDITLPEPHDKESTEDLTQFCMSAWEKQPESTRKTLSERPSVDTVEAQNKEARGMVWKGIPSSIWEEHTFLTSLKLHSLFSCSSLECPWQRLSSKADYNSVTDNMKFHYFGDIILDRKLCDDYPLQDSNIEGTNHTVHDSTFQRRFNIISAQTYLDCLRHRVDPLNHMVNRPWTMMIPDDGLGTDCEDENIHCNTPLENIKLQIYLHKLQFATCFYHSVQLSHLCFPS